MGGKAALSTIAVGIPDAANWHAKDPPTGPAPTTQTSTTIVSDKIPLLNQR